MNLLEKIENAKKELSRRPMDYNEKLSIDGVDIEKSEDKITCIIKYTIIIGNDCDESWGSIDFEIPRLLTDEEMIGLGNVDQYDYDNKIKKYTYYDMTARYGNKNKVGIQNIR